MSALPLGVRLALAGSVVAVLIVAAAIGAVLLMDGGGGGEGSSSSGEKRAAIVDQLSLTQPNPEFIGAARTMLGEAGYEVDYFPGEDVTVDLYRTLPARDYDLLVLRVHAGITTEIDADSGERTETEYVSLFTGEPYVEGKYQDEIDGGYLGVGEPAGLAPNDPAADLRFGIGPRFIEQQMVGEFGGTAIVMMGCDGLKSQRTAEAFLDRGASTFVSWSQPVSAEHTDAATERLLEKLLLEGLDTAEAVSQTAEEVGPDPTYGAELRLLSR